MNGGRGKEAALACDLRRFVLDLETSRLSFYFALFFFMFTWATFLTSLSFFFFLSTYAYGVLSLEPYFQLAHVTRRDRFSRTGLLIARS